MYPLDKVRERYHDDVTFKVVVDSLQHIVLSLEMTPGEIREAATFACILVEEKFRRPMFIMDVGRDGSVQRFERYDGRALRDGQVSPECRVDIRQSARVEVPSDCICVRGGEWRGAAGSGGTRQYNARASDGGAIERDRPQLVGA